MNFRNMKGISLPVETIVIITIVILVLVVIAAFFILNVGKRQTGIVDEDARGRGCVDPRMTCKATTDQEKSNMMNTVILNNYDPDGNGKFDSLLTACTRIGYTVQNCWKACGCP